jgi:hypothetical protein
MLEPQLQVAAVKGRLPVGDEQDGEIVPAVEHGPPAGYRGPGRIGSAS